MRFFAARADGEIASDCELYSRGGDGQIENVSRSSVPQSRPRSSTRLRALERRAQRKRPRPSCSPTATTGQGAVPKLGFDEIGLVYDFLRLRPSSIRGTKGRRNPWDYETSGTG